MSAKKKIRLAVFDIDGTIFRSSLLIELFNTLVIEGIFPKKASQEVEREYVAWLNRKGHYNVYLMKLVRVYHRYQTGCTKKSIDAIVAKVIARQKDRVYCYTRDLIRDLRKRGYLLVANSGSPDYIVSHFAKKLGFSAAFGRTPEIKDGIFTGNFLSHGRRVTMDDHQDKVRILKKFISDKKLEVDLKNSIGVGDSEGDIDMLSFVGQPIAFNPSRILASYARKKSWRIVVERKDVIYDVETRRFIKS